MIEVSKLHKMLKLESETAASFKDLNKKEQQAYIKAHPGSKYASGGGKSSVRNTSQNKLHKDMMSMNGGQTYFGKADNVTYFKADPGKKHLYRVVNVTSKHLVDHLKSKGYKLQGRKKDEDSGTTSMFMSHPDRPNHHVTIVRNYDGLKNVLSSAHPLNPKNVGNKIIPTRNTNVRGLDDSE
jgi:hypothetical protein